MARGIFVFWVFLWICAKIKLKKEKILEDHLIF